MSALVIDTSSWISYFAGRGGESIDEALAEARAYLTPVVAAELLSGTLTRRERRDLEELLTDLPLCVCDREHWFRVGRLRGELRRRGLTVSTPDAHVAQATLDLRGVLLSEDRVFAQIASHVPLALRPAAQSQ
ncbi:MAG: PIN domain-containing protein [Myxococcota bacterium]